MSVYKGEGVCMYVVVWLDVVYVCMDVDVCVCACVFMCVCVYVVVYHFVKWD